MNPSGQDIVQVQLTSRADATGKPHLHSTPLSTPWGVLAFDKDGRAVAKLPASALSHLAKYQIDYSHTVDPDLAAEQNVKAPAGPVDHKKLLFLLEQRHGELANEHDDALRAIESQRRQLDEYRREHQPLHERLQVAESRIRELTDDLELQRGRAENAEKLLGEAATLRDQAKQLLGELEAVKASLAAANEQLEALRTAETPRSPETPSTKRKDR